MFSIDTDLLDHAGEVISRYRRVYWILGGAGSGKSTVCAELSRDFGLAVYDMDEHVYGSYFERFEADRHPANTAWAAAENGLAWLLDMSWDEFDAWNREQRATRDDRDHRGGSGCGRVAGGLKRGERNGRRGGGTGGCGARAGRWRRPEFPGDGNV